MVASHCLHHDGGDGLYFSFHSSLVSFGFAGTDTMVISKEYSSSLIWNLIDKSSWFVSLQLLSCKTVGRGGMMREWRVMSNVENGIASMSRKVPFFQFVFCDVLQFASKRTKSKEIAV
jgi:hypothetical protein